MTITESSNMQFLSWKALKVNVYDVCFELKRLYVIIKCVFIAAAVYTSMMFFSTCVIENVNLSERFNFGCHYVRNTDTHNAKFNYHFNRSANYESGKMADIYVGSGIGASAKSSSLLADDRTSISGRLEELMSAFLQQVTMSHTEVKHATWHRNMIKRIRQMKKDLPYVMKNWNLVKTKTMPTLSNFKNPCWYEKKPLQSKCRLELFQPIPHTDTRSNGTLRCLPYFYIVGMPKSGTTDIYNRLVLHPQIAKTPKKEGLWLHRYRILVPACSGLSSYVDYFHEGAKMIESHHTWTTSPGGAQEKYHDMVTGDGTQGVSWHNTYWPELPGNENCSSVCVTNADLVHHINPHAKIVMSLRNPVDRVYSHYLFSTQWLPYSPSPDAFHKEVVRMIDEFQHCMKMFSLRTCVYNGTHENSRAPVKIRIGMYYVHLSDWLRVFPRDHIHVIRFDDYIGDIKEEMTRLIEFLQLRPVDDDVMKKMLNLTISNKNIARKDGMNKVCMKPETRDLLEEFYKPFNEQLALLLNNTKYKFKN